MAVHGSSVIDHQYKVWRHIAAYSLATDAWVADIDLPLFDLTAFRRQFDERDPTNPMLDSYPIEPRHLHFLRCYVPKGTIDWDFDRYAYYLEATALD